MARSLLENAEIRAVIKDGKMGTLNPWQAAPGGAGSVKVFILNKDFDNAV